MIRRPTPGGVATLGDSLTAGKSWQTVGLLANDPWVAHAVTTGMPYCFDGFIPGYTTGMVNNRLPAVIAHEPDAIVVCTGTHEVLWEMDDLDHPISHLTPLVDRIRSSPGAPRPVLCTLPPLTRRWAEHPSTVTTSNASTVGSRNSRPTNAYP